MAAPDKTCEGCGQVNAGTALIYGRRVCGRASCLLAAKKADDRDLYLRPKEGPC